eukprot:scaffold13395_cov67-Isochrysis_galbana.AAC.4
MMDDFCRGFALADAVPCPPAVPVTACRGGASPDEYRGGGTAARLDAAPALCGPFGAAAALGLVSPPLPSALAIGPALARLFLSPSGFTSPLPTLPLWESRPATHPPPNAAAFPLPPPAALSFTSFDSSPTTLPLPLAGRCPPDKSPSRFFPPFKS